MLDGTLTTQHSNQLSVTRLLINLLLPLIAAHGKTGFLEKLAMAFFCLPCDHVVDGWVDRSLYCTLNIGLCTMSPSVRTPRSVLHMLHYYMYYDIPDLMIQYPLGGPRVNIEDT